MTLTKLFRMFHVAIMPRNWLLKTQLKNGAIVCGKNRKGYGGRGIYIYRDAIEPEFDQLEMFLDRAGVLVDLGANTGIYTIKAAKHLAAGGGQVISVEPFPDVLATLFQNIQINRFKNVRLRNFCAGEQTQAATLWMNYGRPNSFSLTKRDQEASSLCTLTVSLDDLFMWEKLDRLDYLKMDVEGAEAQVLRGGSKTLQKYRPIIQMEVNLEDARMELPNYAAFQAPGSINKVYIPKEHTKFEVPRQLGWVPVN